ncbi:MAG: hypothetical protein PHV83_04020, partial [Bacteroidales bacterium]|nr:hypothetical protein [Bacteroidales bacterium]
MSCCIDTDDTVNFYDNDPETLAYLIDDYTKCVLSSGNANRKEIQSYLLKHINKLRYGNAIHRYI